MQIARRARIAVMVCLIGGLLAMAGCAHDRPWCLERSHVTRAQAHATVQAEGSRGREATYYVFNFDDLPASDLGQMSYKGTAAGYHLFKIYTKCTTNDALVYDIALPERQCEVAHARPVDEETTIANGNYRSPVRSDGRCTVEERRR
jgi:hypothetical protein